MEADGIAGIPNGTPIKINDEWPGRDRGRGCGLDARGRVTAFAFACGAVEARQDGAIRTEMFGEHGKYHVQQFDGDNRRLSWDVFDRLSCARSRFAALRTQAKLQRRTM